MSRAHALAPASATGPSSFGPAAAEAVARRRRPRHSATPNSPYIERALLLWPRLDRAKLRKIADDPARIAEMVVRRTSQPYEAILAMLMRRSPSFAAADDEYGGFGGVPENPRVALRIVRSEEGREIGVQNLLPM